MEIVIQRKTANPDYEKPVVIYRDKNYGGESQELGPGRYAFDKLEIGNDTLSSIKVPDGKMVVLHDRADYMGDKAIVVKDSPDLGQFNDKTSAVVVQIAAEVFKDRDYKSESQTLPLGRYNLADLDIGNETVSSLKVPPGLYVTLFDGPDLSGEKMTFFDDSPFVGEEMNDRTSSIAVGLARTVIPGVESVEDYQDKMEQLASDLSWMEVPDDVSFASVKAFFGR